MPSPIALKNNHLLFARELVDKAFPSINQILISFKPDQGVLLISGADNSWFSKMHESQQIFLKQKNSQGDCAAAIHSLVLDYDINAADRQLPYEVNEKTGFIKVEIT